MKNKIILAAISLFALTSSLFPVCSNGKCHRKSTAVALNNSGKSYLHKGKSSCSGCSKKHRIAALFRGKGHKKATSSKTVTKKHRVACLCKKIGKKFRRSKNK